MWGFSLLAEYTSEARQMQREKDDYARRVRWILAAALILAAFSLVSLLNRFITTPIGIAQSFTPVIIGVVTTIPSALLLVRVEMIRIDKIFDELRLLVNQLYPVMSMASEMEEFADMSPIERLELRLRLTEAEGMLRLIDNKKQKLQHDSSERIQQGTPVAETKKTVATKSQPGIQ